MKMLKCLSAILLAVLLCGAPMTARAHEVPDTTKEGSITVTMRYAGNPVAGGSLTLYRVGEVQENNGDYRFVLTGDFVDSRVQLTDITSPALASQLAQFAASKNLVGQTENIDDKGTVTFTKLELGLYLLVENTAATGYNKAAPFLVSVPMNDKGVYVYDVNATPKVDLEKKPETPETPNAPKLPQTGQLNWPVPVMVVAGLCLFSAGWVLRFGRKNDGYEE